MTSLAYRLPSVRGPSALSLVAGLVVAPLVGLLLVVDPRLAVALLIALGYAAVVLINLPLGIVLWLPLVFLEGIPVFNVAGKAVGALIVIAWLASLGERREAIAAALARHGRLIVVAAALVVWLTLSLAWAQDAGLAAADLWHWVALLVLLAVVITTITSESTLRLALWALVAGAVLSIAIGIADGSFTGAADGGARLEGGAGDPNYLAASLVACAVIAAGLFAVEAGPWRRGLALAALAILTGGLIASGSRGGLLAAGVAIVLSLLLVRRSAAKVAATAALVAGVAALMFLFAPDAWERMTSFDDDNGRSSLWTVGARMWEDEPVAGVGLNNFVVHSADYVKQPGPLEDLKLVVERPHVPHNTYLQLLAEAGVVGLGLFLALCAVCLQAGRRAAIRFEAAGAESLGTVARAVVIATVSVLAAAMFLSAATDKRLWLLLALGPVLLAVAERRATARAAPARR